MDTAVPRLDAERGANDAGGRFAARRWLNRDGRGRRGGGARCRARTSIGADGELAPRQRVAVREGIGLEDLVGVGRRGPGQRIERQPVADRRITRDEEEMFRAEQPRSARPAAAGRFAPALHRQDVADDRIEPLLEDAREAGALLFVLQLRLQRIDVDRQPPLGPEVVPDVFIRRDDVVAIHGQRFRQRVDESARFRAAMPVVLGLVGDERFVAPERHAVAPPPAAERPARQRLARIPLALPEVQQRARREALLQAPDEAPSQMPLRLAERREVPLGAVHVVNRHERRLPAHRQTHVMRPELGVDEAAERVDLAPLLVGVGLGDARRLVDPAHAHLVAERHLALVDFAGHRRRALWIGRGRERNVAFAGHEPGRRVEADPAGARQVDLGPRVQVGEVDVGAARSVERLDVGLELDEVPRDEPRRETEMAQDLHEEPRAVST